MSRTTGIEWTDATWNPIRGCSRVSEGCRNCYAESVANRFCKPGSPYEGVVQIGADGKGNGKWNGQIKFIEKRLLDPLKWGPVKIKCVYCDMQGHPCDGSQSCTGATFRPRRIFVNSMSDLFHENVTDEMRDKIFAVMALCPQHTFQVLTKRPDRMLAYLSHDNERYTARRIFDAAQAIDPKNGYRFDVDLYYPLENVWLGVSVENQKAADERIPLLLQTPAAVRFISAEPLLGSVRMRAVHSDEFGLDYLTGELVNTEPCEENYRMHHCGGLDWVIVGGESGPGARPMHPDWARSLRAGVPFFFKQWGEWAPGAQQADYSRKGSAFTRIDVAGALSNDPTKWLASDALFYRVGKKAAGHLLDGVEWHQMPERAA